MWAVDDPTQTLLLRPLTSSRQIVREARQANEPLPVGWGAGCVRRLCIIRDLKGFSMAHALSPRMDFVKTLMRVTQDNYPHLADHCIFLNTPWVFQICWSVLKTCLAAHTLTKV